MIAFPLLPQQCSTTLGAYTHAPFPPAQVARGILDYLLRDMVHPLGGFYSAEDADSVDPKGGQPHLLLFLVFSGCL